MGHHAVRAKRRRHRRFVVRSGRRYIVCGIRGRGASFTTRFVTWVPGATLLLTMLVSLYAIERPLPPGPVVAVSPYSIEDFANAARR